MSIDIKLVSARYLCTINDKYTVVVNIHGNKSRYNYIDKLGNSRFWGFYHNGKFIKSLPGLDESKIKERIMKLIKSIETPLRKREKE
jgi:hypothetical protein